MCSVCASSVVLCLCQTGREPFWERKRPGGIARWGKNCQPARGASAADLRVQDMQLVTAAVMGGFLVFVSRRFGSGSGVGVWGITALTVGVGSHTSQATTKGEELTSLTLCSQTDGRERQSQNSHHKRHQERETNSTHARKKHQKGQAASAYLSYLSARASEEKSSGRPVGR